MSETLFKALGFKTRRSWRKLHYATSLELTANHKHDFLHLVKTKKGCVQVLGMDKYVRDSRMGKDQSFRASGLIS